MAILSNIDRKALWSELMSEASRDNESLPLTKAELRAAIDGIDDWLEANAASANSAIPQPARSALTAKQKAKLLMIVTAKRFGVG